jgi:hypothetical protein
MTPHKQRFRHDPDNGVYGDCHRTALACLLDLVPEDVPHFGHGAPEGEEFNRRIDEWLATRGLCQASVAYGGELQHVLDAVQRGGPGVYFLLGGTSRTGCNHTVIGCDGAIAWDPSLNDSGIVGPCSDDFYWVTFLVPLAMRKAAA